MKNIYDYLPVGESNAVPSRQLAELCGCKNVRELQQLIESLRLSGHVICSTSQPPGGYFLHSSPHELMSFIRTVENRAYHSLNSIQSAKQALQAMGDAQ